MRFSLLLILLLIITSGVSSGVDRQDPNEPIKYWIFLRDKPATASKGVQAAAHVSRRAHDRRSARGTRSAPSSIDAPVHEAYLGGLSAAGVEPVVVSRWLNAVSARLTPDQAEHISRLPYVKSLRPVGVSRTTRVVDTAPAWPIVRDAVPYAHAGNAGRRIDFGSSANQLRIVNVDGLIEAGWNGAGVRIGIIDTGLADMTHPATKHIVDSGRLIESRDFSGQPPDTERHGFWVLSVAAGYDEGFLVGPAYGAEFLHARTEYGPTETNQEEDAFVAAIEWMEAEGVDVVNISLGYFWFDEGEHSYTYEDMDGDTAITTIAADMAASLGVVVVSSAGNEGFCVPQTPCQYYIGAPADGDLVITAGGVNWDGSRYRSSSYGPTADGRIKPDVAAQGTSIQFAYLNLPGLEYRSSGAGTSFSSPMVAAVSALLLQANPSLTPVQVREILRSTASQASNPDNSLGWGVIDAEAAMSIATSIQTESIPDGFDVGFWPNPFADRLSISIRGASLRNPLRLVLYDVLGRELSRIERPAGASGTWDLDLSTLGPASGLLLYRLEADGITSTGSLVRLPR